MMKFMKYLLVASMLLFMAAPAVMAADKEPVVIGLQGPITGAWAYEGQMAKQSCEIAADLINKRAASWADARLSSRWKTMRESPRPVH